MLIFIKHLEYLEIFQASTIILEFQHSFSKFRLLQTQMEQSHWFFTVTSHIEVLQVGAKFFSVQQFGYRLHYLNGGQHRLYRQLPQQERRVLCM